MRLCTCMDHLVLGSFWYRKVFLELFYYVLKILVESFDLILEVLTNVFVRIDV